MPLAKLVYCLSAGQHAVLPEGKGEGTGKETKLVFGLSLLLFFN